LKNRYKRQNKTNGESELTKETSEGRPLTGSCNAEVSRRNGKGAHGEKQSRLIIRARGEELGRRKGRQWPGQDTRNK